MTCNPGYRMDAVVASSRQAGMKGRETNTRGGAMDVM